MRAADAARLDALKHHIVQTAHAQRKPAKASVLVAQTRRSSITPGPEGRTRAAAATIKKLEATDNETESIEKAKAEIKEALKDKLLRAMPDSKSGEDAKKAVSPETGQAIAGEMKGELTVAQAKTTGDLPAATQKPENPSQYAPGDPPPLAPTSAGARPALPSPAGAVPDKLPDAALDTQADRKDADAQLASENLSQDQLKRSNEPSFVDAANTRDEAERHSETGPPEVRKAEQEARTQAQGRAANSLGHGIFGMFGSRAAGFQRAFTQQSAAKAKEEAQRAQIAQDLDNIQRKTSNDVKHLLDYMDAGAQFRFNFGLITARQAFENQLVKTEAIIRKINRDDALSTGNAWGVLTASWGDLSEDDAELTIRWARRAYNKEIDRVIDDVGNFIGPILARIKQRIAQGKQEAADYVARLDHSVADIAAAELDRVNGEFDTLSSQVEQRRDALITKLSESYEASKKAIEERAQAFRDANKSWWQKLKEKVRGVIRAIVQIKDMFATLLKRVAGVVGAILSDPAGFLDNLVAGVKRGLNNFIAKFLIYLKAGFFEWLFGTAAKAGIQVPKKFDAAGIFMLLASILGLTVANIRSRAVAKVGEGPVKALETGAGILMALKEKGLAGLWEMLVEKLDALKESVIEQVQSMLTTEVIQAGITWIIGLLNPAAGFIKACKAIYEIVKFFVNNWDRIVEFVNSVLDSIGAIARGQVDAAADLVEKTLARTIPIIIGFLAGLLGLGDIAEKVKKVIERIQAPVNRAIDWLIDKAVALVKRGAAAIKGLFGKKDKKDEQPAVKDPAKQALLEQGLAALHAEEASREHDGEISKEDSQAVADRVRAQHPIFKSLEVIDGGDRWDFVYVVNPRGGAKGGQKDGNKRFQVESFGRRPGFREDTRVALPVGSGEHRRHVVAWEVLHQRLLDATVGKKVSDVCKMLSKLGYKPAKISTAAAVAAGRQYLIDKHNDPSNLWVGPGAENSSLGAQALHARNDAEAAIRAKDRAKFDKAIATLRVTWHDPDPTKKKAGFTTTLEYVIRALEKEFQMASKGGKAASS